MSEASVPRTPRTRTASNVSGTPQTHVATIPSEARDTTRPITEISAPEPSIRRESPGETPYERDYAGGRRTSPPPRTVYARDNVSRTESPPPQVPLGRDFAQHPSYAEHPDVIRVRSGGGGRQSPAVIRVSSPSRSAPLAATPQELPAEIVRVASQSRAPGQPPAIIRVASPSRGAPPELAALSPSSALDAPVSRVGPSAQSVPSAPEIPVSRVGPSAQSAPLEPEVPVSRVGRSVQSAPSEPEVPVSRVGPSAPPAPSISAPHESLTEIVRVASRRTPPLAGQSPGVVRVSSRRPPSPTGPPQHPSAVPIPAAPGAPSIHLHQEAPRQEPQREPEIIRVRSSGRESPAVIRVTSPVDPRAGPSHVHIHHDGAGVSDAARQRGVTFQPRSDSGRAHEGYYGNVPPTRIPGHEVVPEPEESPQEYSPSTRASGPQDFAEGDTQRSASPRSDLDHDIRESRATEAPAPTIVPTIASRSPSPIGTVQTDSGLPYDEAPPVGRSLEYGDHGLPGSAPGRISEESPAGTLSAEGPESALPAIQPSGERGPSDGEYTDSRTTSQTPSGSDISPDQRLGDTARAHLDDLDRERQGLFDRAESQRQEAALAAEARREAAAREFDEAERRRQTEFEDREAERQRLFEEAEAARAAAHEERRHIIAEEAEQSRQSLADTAAGERAEAERSLRESLLQSVQVSQDLVSTASAERQSVADLASLVQASLADKAESEEEQRRLSAAVLSEREEVVDQQAARIRELEDELRLCREECEAERAQRRELQELQAAEARAEADGRHNEIHGRLGDIQNALQDRVDADARRQELEEERLAAKDTRRADKDERLGSLHDLINSIITDREDEKRRVAEEREAAAAKPCTCSNSRILNVPSNLFRQLSSLLLMNCVVKTPN